MTIAIRLLAFVLGLAIVFGTARSFIRMFVLPRAAQDPVVRIFFLAMRKIFDIFVNRLESYTAKDQWMAYYAPVTLILLLPFWYTLMLVGYMFMFWGWGPKAGTWRFGTAAHHC